MIDAPLAVIAEITHRCPLHCLYCSNPLDLARSSMELSTQEWQEVFEQCTRLGVLHVHFSGGEPLARKEVVDLVASVHSRGLYTNLITSGIGLTDSSLEALI